MDLARRIFCTEAWFPGNRPLVRQHVVELGQQFLHLGGQTFGVRRIQHISDAAPEVLQKGWRDRFFCSIVWFHKAKIACG